jgi:hypothetical protein
VSYRKQKNEKNLRKHLLYFSGGIEEEHFIFQAVSNYKERFDECQKKSLIKEDFKTVDESARLLANSIATCNKWKRELIQD